MHDEDEDGTAADRTPGEEPAATTPATHGFLLLHGWQNHRPPGHWQHWLAGRLGELGHEVGYPQLPDPDDPCLERWLDELRGHLDTLRGQRRTVVCHSLACLLWLHAVARGAVAVPVDRVLLVAPPSSEVLRQHTEVREFAAPTVTPAEVSAASAYTRVIGSDNDPYCPEGAAARYGEQLGLPSDTLPGQAHLDLDAGYGDWPSLLDWCLGTDTAPVTARRGRPHR
ncbi:alpha/beta hydrolase [Streptomyces sp. NPDC007861]|uniref:RBBP9/YdeN family alpha/beta hydrolase n=1 Tax=Streptomyces sp. NPDC007861 TaxID=3154893 RepID=UPI0033DF5CA5